MVLRSFSILTIVAFGLCLPNKLYLPVPTCKRDTTDYSSCLRRATQEAWPLFIKGLPDEFDFAPLDPYFEKYQEMEINNDIIYGNVNLSNITIEGLRTARFKTVRSHISDDVFHLDIDLHIPKFDVKFFHDTHGNIAGIRFDDEGYFNATIEGVRMAWDISGFVKDDTLTIKHFRITLMVKNSKVYLNTFNNPDIGKLITIFMNGNWPILARILMPIAADYLDTYYSDFINHLFAKLSFSQVFP